MRLAPFALLTLTACTTAATPPLVVDTTSEKVVPNGGGSLLVAEARAALDRRDSEAAVRLAELAVTATPAAPAARLVLARSYVAAGRFDAAVTAWSDAIEVAPADNAAHLGRALALLATGQTRAAVEMLARLEPSDDVGLALALAGDPRGLAMLAATAQAPTATGRTRQNLALAHAIVGEWTQARAVAAADVPEAAIPARLAEWSRVAGATPSQRVAIILGVKSTPVDFGRPAPLAPPRVAPKPEQPKAMTVAYLPLPVAASGWVVQVGAYPSPAERDAALAALSNAKVVKGYAPLLDTRAKWHRVSLTGFSAKLQAQRLCVRLKQSGTDCFVRLEAPRA